MAFPPYQLFDNDHVRETQQKFGRLERLYHHGQEQAWDGRKVLRELLDKHGGIHISDEKREAIGQLFSTILWGELAAWSISADLALMLEDTEAKMAATSQAFDEARHFYVMRDYLLELGGGVPRLDGFTHVVLNDLLGTRRLVDKLLGMQLIVESVALTLFRSVAEARVEPVLSDLMPYYERDESRHVALGVMYLPALLRQVGPLESTRLQLLQLKLLTFIGWGSHVKRPYFEVLGIDNNAGMHRGMKLQKEIFRKLVEAAGGRTPGAVLVGAEAMESINLRGIDLFFPPNGAQLPRWQSAMIGLCCRLANLGERTLRRAVA
jgi:hypothetical protein